ncbi:hypothetical protein VSH64_28530 [Amycolatopsis rhabdoformis]|uniref:Uncharacterized protein n=1 Tax=Amycolatopsis rhabdoformis TaxID=1448059 RepID=A0ABZ1HXF8_9PSEU|nr:hypothetical protein [Amycolatopsis rhabdoformis]WSE26821.1 hypothetical protein VSH64_28530 [Amycolatopsis rhabdoformis]
MHAWWPLATVAAVFVVLAMVYLRRSARPRGTAQPAAPPSARRLLSPEPVRVTTGRGARHRADPRRAADPLARYPVARQRPVSNAVVERLAGADSTPTQPFPLPQPRVREGGHATWPAAAPPRPTPPGRRRLRPGKINTDPAWPGPPIPRSRPAVPDPSGRGRGPRSRRADPAEDRRHPDD